MIPFDMLYQVARERDEELRRATCLIGRARGGESTLAQRRKLQGRLAGVLRSVADQLDPAH